MGKLKTLMRFRQRSLGTDLGLTCSRLGQGQSFSVANASYVKHLPQDAVLSSPEDSTTSVKTTLLLPRMW